MANQSMHCGFRRTNTQSDAEAKNFLSREIIGQDQFNIRPEDRDITSDTWTTNSINTNNNSLCTIFTIFQPSGHCSVVALPLSFSDGTISLGSGSANRRKTLEGPTTNQTYRPNLCHQSLNTEERNENEEDKATKKKLKKKAKKKAKQTKKPVNSVSECSTSEPDANKMLEIVCTADVEASEPSLMPKATGSCDSVWLASNSEYSFNTAADEESSSTIDISKSPPRSKGCSSLVEKRNKPQQIRRLPKNSGSYKGIHLGHSQGRFGKENSHSVWQRVERNNIADGDECSSENNSLTKLYTQDSDILSCSEDKNQTKVMLSGKSKRKSVKQENSNCFLRKDSHDIKSCSTLGTTNYTEESQVSEEPELDFQPKKFESISFKKVPDLDPVDSAICSVESQEFLEEIVDETQVFKQMCCTEKSKQETISGTVLQKWVPVGVKNQPRSSPMVLQEESSCGSQCLVLEEAVHIENCTILETEENGTIDDVSSNHSNISKTCRALIDVKRAQLASEDIFNATGYPVAEFERFLHTASPDICQSDSTIRCQRCSHDDTIFNESLCVHELPDISLGNVWQWYEEHGIYGLKVKADNFDAFFAPSLSAVQLFEKCSSTAKNDEDPKLEVLFEYFESEQPQKRQSLFHTIKELVEGRLPDRSYGDPTILDSISLHDLHPESWYSVAWYPIYVIPDGNLRAAFLTYHSLGHLVRRSSFCGEISVVSPVVGLQSYNAQGECWFRERQTEMVEGFSNMNPGRVVKERITTLEKSASLMACATVTKGSTSTYTNRQPDYEFFLSRRS